MPPAAVAAVNLSLLMGKMIDPQEKEIKIITSALLKGVTVVCVCILVGLALHSCQLDSVTIADCNDACQSATGQMESVTSYTCTCTSSASSTSPWVIN